ncbi:MAG: BBE domain-containing protein, partial [Pseudonocardiaceae bacterium]
GSGGVYLNFTGLADEPMRAGVDDALGRNLRRLAKIKATYDPQSFFRYNNILPAEGLAGAYGSQDAGLAGRERHGGSDPH